MTSLPIACTLAPGTHAERVAWIAALNRDALRGHERDGLVLRLRYQRGAAARVRELVARESECCAFLTFTIRDSDHETALRIEAPEGARPVLAEIFAPFLSGTTDAMG